VNKVIWAWLAAVLVILFLYVGAVALFANHVKPTVLGMPFLYFWYVLIPLLNPIILGLLYLYDARRNPQFDVDYEMEEM
jgi:hypothetical protein